MLALIISLPFISLSFNLAIELNVEKNISYVLSQESYYSQKTVNPYLTTIVLSCLLFTSAACILKVSIRLDYIKEENNLNPDHLTAPLEAV